MCSLVGQMYLMSWMADQSLLEASLGGKVTADEIHVLKEELLELLNSVDNPPLNLLLDCSRAQPLNAEASKALYMLADECCWAGTQKLVCVPCDTLDLQRHTVARLQNVLEGREDYVLDIRQAIYVQPEPVQVRLAS